MSEYSLPMGPEEIVVSYKTAADPKKQLKILAELNVTSVERIAEILRDRGIKIDGRWLNRGVKSKKEVTQMEKKEEHEKPSKDAAPEEIMPSGDAVPELIRHAAIDAIAELLNKLGPVRSPFTEPNVPASDTQVLFSEQVRGVLALVHAAERRCRETSE